MKQPSCLARAVIAVLFCAPLLGDLLDHNGLIGLMAAIALGMFLPRLAIPARLMPWLIASYLAFMLTHIVPVSPTLAIAELAAIYAITGRTPSPGLTRFGLACAAGALGAGLFTPATPLAPWSLLIAHAPTSAGIALNLVVACILAALTPRPHAADKRALRVWAYTTAGLTLTAIAIGRAAEGGYLPASRTALCVALLTCGALLVPADTRESKLAHPLSPVAAFILPVMAAWGGSALWAWTWRVVLPVGLAFGALNELPKARSIPLAIGLCVLALLLAPALPADTSDGARLGLCAAALATYFLWPAVLGEDTP